MSEALLADSPPTSYSPPVVGIIHIISAALAEQGIIHGMGAALQVSGHPVITFQDRNKIDCALYLMHDCLVIDKYPTHNSTRVRFPLAHPDSICDLANRLSDLLGREVEL